MPTAPMVQLEEGAVVPNGCNLDHPHREGRGGGLIVGNYCHDVLFRNERPVGETLGGAASFVSNVLDSLVPSPSPPLCYVSKVGPDFAYAVPHPPINVPAASTTLFHAHFTDCAVDGGYRSDRVLRRVRSCDPITPSDLPSDVDFQFGLAVGVSGEILPETLTRMIDLCRVVFVDVQGLIRSFDPVDGTVGLVPLKESGYFHLLPRIGFLKASSEEAPFVDVEEARKFCCVIVTEGKDGCRVYWKNSEINIVPFPAVQIDPTGAGDSFLGGFVAGLLWGLSVQDAALLGNFFGSITVGQIGVPKFNLKMMEYIKQELEARAMQHGHSRLLKDISVDSEEPVAHEDLKDCLNEAAKLALYDQAKLAGKVE